MMRVTLSHKLLALTAGGALVLAACGGGDDDDQGGGGSADAGPLVVGTTDAFETVDPAGSYSKPDWGILYNVGQTLLTIPPGESEPVPELAEECNFTDETTYECTLVSDAVFSDDTPITSAEVKHSFDRMLEINDPQGPATVFETLDSVDAPSEDTVVFNLARPDTTWPQRLTTGAATIVPESFPTDELQPNNPEDLVFSGPYQIEQFDPDEQIVLEPNPNYSGDKQLANDGVLIQPIAQENQLKTQLEQGDVDVAYRSLNPTIVQDLEENGAENGVEVVRGAGTEISYFVFAYQREPFDQQEVRQAVASLLDREAIASNVYNDTVQPLYSIVPDVLEEEQVPAFEEEYGTEPDPEAAENLLEQADVETPVEIDFWYVAERYGEESLDMYQEIARQLEDSGLFETNLDTMAWEQYQEAYEEGRFDAFQLGWFPDFPDADNYLSPFYAGEPGHPFFGEAYAFPNDTSTQLLNEQLQEEELENRIPIFGELQRLGAEEATVVPIWQRDMIAGIREGVTGVEDTFDAANTFRYWMVAPPEE